LWLFKQDGDLIGYLFAEIVPTEYETNAVLIHQSYSKGNADWQEMDSILYEWGKPYGVTELFFFTRRNPKAFARRLNTNWELDSYLLRRRFNTQ
jgi:hypothetical protein